MYKLEYEFHNNIPVFKCDFCGNCSGVLESSNKLNINRGCCWYFPKYTLMDIKNLLNNGNRTFVESLFLMKNAHISQYHIHLQGIFDFENYEKYKNEHGNYKEDFETKLFFRICPFISKKGCSIDFSLRPHPCNLYLCRSILNWNKDNYKEYSDERKDYFSYCNYFNESLKYELIDNKVDFLIDYKTSLNILENYEIPNFHPRDLKPINFTNDDNNGSSPIGKKIS